jgi:hypothetical protein
MERRLLCEEARRDFIGVRAKIPEYYYDPRNTTTISGLRARKRMTSEEQNAQSAQLDPLIKHRFMVHKILLTSKAARKAVRHHRT